MGTFMAAPILHVWYTHGVGRVTGVYLKNLGISNLNNSKEF
jgi:hypothetical protein